MRLIPSSAGRRTSLRLPLILAAIAGLANAVPYPNDDLYSYLRARSCPNPCGSESQYCCNPDQKCTTLQGNVASCIGGDGGNYGQYTTTWTETKTYTSTIMTHWEPAPEPTAGVDCVPKNSDQEACGPICCAAWQTCAYNGQCAPRPGFGQGTTVVVTSNGKVTTQYSAPFRVTGTTTVTTQGIKTNTATATATDSTSTPDPSATSDGDSAGSNSGTSTSSGSHLSAGAIAGIVIGTIAGVALLLLLCFCCIARGLWNAIFGKKKEKEHKERIDVYDERYSRHGSRVPSAYSRRDRHTGWFGGGGRPSSAGDRREKKSDGKKWLGLAGGAATLLALLNMKKDKRPARKTGASRYSDSYYTYSDATSPSSSSSGGRTAGSRRTRDSRGTRSQYTRASRRP